MELNKIYNSDCINGMKSMADKSVDLVLTDIPYGEVNRSDSGLRTISKGNADVVTFNLMEFVYECARISRGGGISFVVKGNFQLFLIN